MIKIKPINIGENTIDKNVEYDSPDMSYVGGREIFFDEKYLHSKEDLIKIKEKLVIFLSDKEENDKLNNVQRKFYINKLSLIFLYIDYHEYFEKRYGKMSYRFIGELNDEDLEEDMERIKASTITSLIDNYSHDGGFVDFWSFADSIVFRTIKKIR